MASASLNSHHSQLFIHLGVLADSVGQAQSQTKGLLALQSPPLILVAVGETVLTFLRIRNGSAQAVSELNQLLHQLEINAVNKGERLWNLKNRNDLAEPE
jgi:hypothetical protein